MNHETHTVEYLEANAASYENLAHSAAEGMKKLAEGTSANLAQIESIAAMTRDISERLQAIQNARRAPPGAAATPSAGESFARAWDHFMQGCRALTQRR